MSICLKDVGKKVPDVFFKSGVEEIVLESGIELKLKFIMPKTKMVKVVEVVRVCVDGVWTVDLKCNDVLRNNALGLVREMYKEHTRRHLMATTNRLYAKMDAILDQQLLDKNASEEEAFNEELAAIRARAERTNATAVVRGTRIRE